MKYYYTLLMVETATNEHTAVTLKDISGNPHKWTEVLHCIAQMSQQTRVIQIWRNSDLVRSGHEKIHTEANRYMQAYKKSSDDLEEKFSDEERVIN